MLEVIIKVNGEPVTHRVAVNVTTDHGGVYSRGMQLYCVRDLLQNTNWNLKHSFSQGANALARKMLIRPKAGVKTGIE